MIRADIEPCALLLSHVRLFAAPWTVAHQAPLSMGILHQKFWSGLPSLPPVGLPNPGTERRSAVLQADSLPSEATRYMDTKYNIDNY